MGDDVESDEAVNNKKCYSCGKVFRTPANLLAHKNRKTPCLIREVPQEHLCNPNRCIFCNKIFSQQQTLTRHLKTCKIKNGGMDILVDKVRYEQEIRILKERDLEKDKRIQMLEEKLESYLNTHTERLAAPTQIANTIINNTMNITINNFLQPNLGHLINKHNPIESAFIKIFNENKVQTPLALVPLIWFNPDHPENFSIYLVNKSTGEMLTYNDGRWKVGNFQGEIGKAIRDRAYEITEKLFMLPKVDFSRDEWIINNIKKNRNDEDTIKYDFEQIFKTLLENRELIKPHVITV